MRKPNLEVAMTLRRTSISNRRWFAAAVGAFALTALAAAPAAADPDSWKPGYGYGYGYGYGDDHDDWRDGDRYEHKHRRKHRERADGREYGYGYGRGGYGVTPLAGSGPCGGGSETLGTIIGAATGGLLGANIGRGDGRLAAVGAGTLLGAVIGGTLGRNVDRVDGRCGAPRRVEYVPARAPVAWRDPDAGLHRRTRDGGSYDRGYGDYCRPYETTVNIDGRTEIVRGLACREADGRWRVVE